MDGRRKTLPLSSLRSKSFTPSSQRGSHAIRMRDIFKSRTQSTQGSATGLDAMCRIEVAISAPRTLVRDFCRTKIFCENAKTSKKLNRFWKVPGSSDVVESFRNVPPHPFHFFDQGCFLDKGVFSSKNSPTPPQYFVGVLFKKVTASPGYFVDVLYMLQKTIRHMTKRELHS